MNQDDKQQDVSLAVLARDIHYISTSIAKIETQLAGVITSMANFVTRDELRTVNDANNNFHKDIERRLEAQGEINVDMAKAIVRISTEIKVWLTVGGFILTVVQGIFFFALSKLV